MPVVDISLQQLDSTSHIHEDIQRRLAAERERLLAELKTQSPPQHFARPAERPFTAAERSRVTILFGGLTWKHESVIRAAFEGSGYRCQILPVPNVAAFQIGKEYGNNGQCNPTYFTVGNLVQFLKSLQAQGLSRQQIIDDYVFFTAGSCGPCRFGMYEAEYRLALRNAGFEGFRVLLFQQNEGIKAASGEPGLKFTVDFGMSMFHALNLGDILNEMIYRIRPYEAEPGKTDRVFREFIAELCQEMRERTPYEILQRTPPWISQRLARNKKLKDVLNSFAKVGDHLYGRQTEAALAHCAERLSTIEVDRLKVKPVVKIIGEFWAQITEGDGNFNMFAFLEREGAQVLVEPIATWVLYMMYQARIRAIGRKGLEQGLAQWWEVGKKLRQELGVARTCALLSLGERIYANQYHRTVRALGNVAHELISQKELARLAQPYYHRLARGGEGHLEVGKNIYYTVHHLCHMVLALKPFGCMPSSQSDGVQSAVANHFKEMIFLPIETSGEGEINAHSRVQMALGEAKVRAKAEFEQCLSGTGRTLPQIRDYVAAHPELRHPFYQVPHVEGVTGVAAQFVLHVDRLMKRDERAWRRTRIFREEGVRPLALSARVQVPMASAKADTANVVEKNYA